MNTNINFQLRASTALTTSHPGGIFILIFPASILFGPADFAHATTAAVVIMHMNFGANLGKILAATAHPATDVACLFIFACVGFFHFVSPPFVISQL
jgi:hypothetical protein